MRFAVALALTLVAPVALHAAATPVRSRTGLVVSPDEFASEVGAAVLREGGTAVDAAVATAFALAVTHPAAGNIGGGGFLLHRAASGAVVAYDFREMAPAGSGPTMFLKDGRYDPATHHDGPISVGVPGSVAGLHLAWKAHGRLPWRRLVQPAVTLARDGFVVSDDLADSLADVLPDMSHSPAAVAQFSKGGVPYQAGELLKQPDLARSLERIATSGPAGFYEGETARLLEQEMTARGGLVRRADLAAYQPKLRVPVRGTYRGYEVIGMPPPSSGGVVIQTVLNMLEGDDLAKRGFGSASTVHLVAEALRRAFSDRAQHLGDPDFNVDLPLARLVSKEHAAGLRASIRDDRASISSPASFTWNAESSDTLHLSVVDAERNAVALTTTLEDSYGSRIVVPGAGFLLNNEMGDFNAGPGLTDATGLVGTAPNLAAPRKRMLSSMSPTILAKDGKVFMVTGSPGARTIISTVLQTILNVVDFGMNVQDAVDAPRFHHQWLPDRIQHERRGLSPDTLALLAARGHALDEVKKQGAAQAIVVDPRTGVAEGGFDRRRAADSAAARQ